MLSTCIHICTNIGSCKISTIKRRTAQHNSALQDAAAPPAASELSKGQPRAPQQGTTRPGPCHMAVSVNEGSTFLGVMIKRALLV